jgi:hypothetical protein
VAHTAEHVLGRGWRSGSGLWMHVQAFTGQLWAVWQAAGAGACWLRPDGDTRARRQRPGNLAATCAHCSPSGRMRTLNASIGARHTGSPECLQRRALGARRHPRPHSPGSPHGPHPNTPPDGSVSPRIDYAEQTWMGNPQLPTQVSHGDRSGGGEVGGQEKGRATRSAGVAWPFCAHQPCLRPPICTYLCSPCPSLLPLCTHLPVHSQSIMNPSLWLVCCL